MNPIDKPNQIEEVLLIDDCEADNFLNTRLLNSLGYIDKISVALNGQEAIDYLLTPQDGQLPMPELICLDINMPVMDGWEFLEAAEQLPELRWNRIYVMMVSTSMNRQDEQHANMRPLVSRFAQKPLTKEAIEAAISEHFPDFF